MDYDSQSTIKSKIRKAREQLRKIKLDHRRGNMINESNPFDP